jgi:hypothetical protein
MRGRRGGVLAVLLATACSPGVMAQDPGTLAVASIPGAIVLGAGPAEVTLVAAGGNSVASRLKSVDGGRQIYLTFLQAQAQSAPSTTYNVYLGLAANDAPGGTGDPHYVGTINFFNAATGRPIDMSLNITSKVDALLAVGDIGDSLRMTIVPAGDPPADAAPRIGGVRITAR